MKLLQPLNSEHIMIPLPSILRIYYNNIHRLSDNLLFLTMQVNLKLNMY